MLNKIDSIYTIKKEIDTDSTIDQIVTKNLKRGNKKIK